MPRFGPDESIKAPHDLLPDNRPLSEIYASTGEEWVDADAAANELEDCKSSVLSQRMLEHIAQGVAVNRAEALVKASSEWITYVHDCVEARRKANLLRVKLETIKMRHREWIGSDANERLAARL